MSDIRATVNTCGYIVAADLGCGRRYDQSPDLAVPDDQLLGSKILVQTTRESKTTRCNRVGERAGPAEPNKRNRGRAETSNSR